MTTSGEHSLNSSCMCKPEIVQNVWKEMKPMKAETSCSWQPQRLRTNGSHDDYYSWFEPTLFQTEPINTIHRYLPIANALSYILWIPATVMDKQGCRALDCLSTKQRTSRIVATSIVRHCFEYSEQTTPSNPAQSISAYLWMYVCRCTEFHFRCGRMLFVYITGTAFYGGTNFHQFRNASWGIFPTQGIFSGALKVLNSAELFIQIRNRYGFAMRDSLIIGPDWKYNQLHQ